MFQCRSVCVNAHCLHPSHSLERIKLTSGHTYPHAHLLDMVHTLGVGQNGGDVVIDGGLKGRGVHTTSERGVCEGVSESANKQAESLNSRFFRPVGCPQHPAGSIFRRHTRRLSRHCTFCVVVMVNTLVGHDCISVTIPTPPCLLSLRDDTSVKMCCVALVPQCVVSVASTSVSCREAERGADTQNDVEAAGRWPSFAPLSL
jgi:hypothetical protein